MYGITLYDNTHLEHAITCFDKKISRPGQDSGRDFQMP
jgi:hypothetical protein